jgi:hypothetical protein
VKLWVQSPALTNKGREEGSKIEKKGEMEGGKEGERSVG